MVRNYFNDLRARTSGLLDYVALDDAIEGGKVEVVIGLIVPSQPSQLSKEHRAYLAGVLNAEGSAEAVQAAKSLTPAPAPAKAQRA